MHKIIVDYNPTESDNQFLTEQLIAFNEKVFGEREKPLSIFIKDDAGKIVGGLQGGLDSESLYIDILWVADNLRNQGYGTQLLQAAEQEALHYGCQYSTTNTFDFQAVDFYLKNGYQKMGEICNYTFGHANIFVRKKLK